MTDIIVLLVIIVIIALAILKIVSEKRKGKACIGCAESGKCDSTKRSKHNPIKKKRKPFQSINIKQIV